MHGTRNCLCYRLSTSKVCIKEKQNRIISVFTTVYSIHISVFRRINSYRQYQSYVNSKVTLPSSRLPQLLFLIKHDMLLIYIKAYYSSDIFVRH